MSDARRYAVWPEPRSREVDRQSPTGLIFEVPYTQGAQVRITQCYLQTTPYLPLPGERCGFTKQYAVDDLIEWSELIWMNANSKQNQNKWFMDRLLVKSRWHHFWYQLSLYNECQNISCWGDSSSRRCVRERRWFSIRHRQSSMPVVNGRGFWIQ